jgi:hypothetical protein
MSFSSALSSISNNPPELDHIVHLVKPGKLDECIKLYKKLGFNPEKGGGVWLHRGRDKLPVMLTLFVSWQYTRMD